MVVRCGLSTGGGGLPYTKFGWCFPYPGFCCASNSWGDQQTADCPDTGISRSYIANLAVLNCCSETCGGKSGL